MKRLTVVRLLIAVVAASIIVAAFVRIDSASHSVSDTLIGWVPIAVLVLVIAWVTWIVAERLQARRS